MRREWVVWLLAMWGIVGLAGCKGEANGAEQTAEVVKVAVETMTLSSSNFIETIEVSGVAEPIHEVAVAAEAAGRVVQAPFEVGEDVKKNALVVRVDAQVDSARLDLLQNQLDTSRREFERTKMLAREGLATPQQLDQAASAVDAASLNIKQARVGMGKTTVRSPIAGVVAEKYVEVGEYVGPGTPLAHIVDYETIIFNTAVPETDVAHVKVGAKVQVWLPALDRHVDGLIQRRAMIADAKTRTYTVEVQVPNTNLEILPGMRGRVIIPRKTWEGVVVVPRDAILQGYESKEAMVLPGTEAEGAAELRRVELGPARGDRIVVTEGLEAGDRLIVKGHRGLVDGSEVKVVGEVKRDVATNDPAVKSEAGAEAAAPEEELAATPDSASPAN